jgi:hypothetical protein
LADPITLEFLAAQQRRLLDEIVSIRTELTLVRTQQVQTAEDIRVLSAMAMRQDATLRNHTELLHMIISQQNRLGERITLLEDEANP